MSKRRRYVLAALVAVLLAALVAAVVLSYGDPERASAPETVPPGSPASTCPSEGSADPEGRDGLYRDPAGDALAGHGDIGRVEVSVRNGVFLVETVAPHLRGSDAVVVTFDTDCDGKDDFVLRVWNDGSTYLSQLTEEGVPITDLPASATRRGSTYTTRFESREIGRAAAFRFRMRVDTEEYEVHADLAPDDESSFWTFGEAPA